MAALRLLQRMLIHIMLFHLKEIACFKGDSGFYASNGHQTVAFPHVPERQQTLIKEEMMEMLGLPRQPKDRKRQRNSAAPAYMQKLYDELERREDMADNNDDVMHLRNVDQLGVGDADLVVSFVNSVKEQKFRHIRHENSRRFFYDLSEVDGNERLVNAEFHIYRHHNRSPDSNQIRLVLSALVKDHADGVLHSKPILNATSNQRGWLRFNITTTVLLWHKDPTQNYGLLLDVSSVFGNTRMRSIDAGLEFKSPERQPFLLGLFNSQNDGVIAHSRRKRRAAADRKTSRKKSKTHASSSFNSEPNYIGFDKYNKRRRSCQLRELYVSFKKLGWGEWIIAPKSYPAYYCEGACSFPLNSHSNATNHAIVQTLLHHFKPMAVPQPCCVPKKLSAIKVLYFDNNNNVRLRNYKNMVVKSCACH